MQLKRLRGAVRVGRAGVWAAERAAARQGDDAADDAALLRAEAAGPPQHRGAQVAPSCGESRDLQLEPLKLTLEPFKLWLGADPVAWALGGLREAAAALAAAEGEEPRALLARIG